MDNNDLLGNGTSGDDLLSIMDMPKEENNTNNNVEPTTSKSKINLWEDHIDKVKVDDSKLLRFNRMFAVITVGEVPGEINLSIEKICKLLYSVGFTHRYNGDNSNTGGMLATKACSDRNEVYLPWKKFNTDVEAKLTKPTLEAYQHGAYFHHKFNDMVPAVRAIIASNVNVLLGDTCTKPLNVLVVYTSEGAETAGEVKYETTGNASLSIKAAEELNIPVFNLKNKTALERLSEFIATLNK